MTCFLVSLLVRCDSLLAPKIFPVRPLKFPVRPFREFPEKGQRYLHDLALCGPEIQQFPCIFPDNREFDRRERFASGCAIRQAVCTIYLLFGDGDKSQRDVMPVTPSGHRHPLHVERLTIGVE